MHCQMMKFLPCSVSPYSPKLTKIPIQAIGFTKNRPFNVFANYSINFVKNAKPLGLVINASADGGLEPAGADTAVVVENPSSKLSRFEVFDGYPAPFGATARDGGVNFAVFSGNATSSTLCLISVTDLPLKRVSEQFTLDPLANKTGDVWHVFLKGDFENMLYGYKFDGKFSPEEGHLFDSSRIVLDPYAKAIISRGEFGALGLEDDCWPPMACMVPSSTDEFDWEGDLPLKFPQRDLVIYEMHVRGFTRHGSSKVMFPGTYRGVVEKLDHLLDELLGLFNSQFLFTDGKIFIHWYSKLWHRCCQ